MLGPESKGDEQTGGKHGNRMAARCSGTRSTRGGRGTERLDVATKLLPERLPLGELVGRYLCNVGGALDGPIVLEHLLGIIRKQVRQFMEMIGLGGAAAHLTRPRE